MITIRNLSIDNIEAALALSVDDWQRKYVRPNAEMIALAYVGPQELFPIALYAGEELVDEAGGEQGDGHRLGCHGEGAGGRRSHLGGSGGADGVASSRLAPLATTGTNSAEERPDLSSTLKKRYSHSQPSRIQSRNFRYSRKSCIPGPRPMEYLTFSPFALNLVAVSSFFSGDLTSSTASS